jgi:transcriptional regulator with XRE-family HTH domain
MTPDEIDALLASPETALAEALAQEDQHLLHALVMWRRELGLSQSTVAERMGVSQAAVSLFERVGNDPHLSSVRRYARALGVLVRHHIDTDGAEHVARSETLAHLGGTGIAASPTAAAAWRVPQNYEVEWNPSANARVATEVSA